jgi:HEAT repeat protein
LLHKRARAALLHPHAERAQGLLEALRGATDETAPQLASLLARLATADALRTLFEALHLPNVAARKAAATALAALGSREAFSALQRQALEDTDAEVRRVCALLISQ